MVRQVFAAVVLVLARVSCGPEQLTELAFGAHQVVPQSYFAMNILFHPLNHVPWPNVPLGGWRTAHVNWADLEPERDHWSFDLLDKYVGWSQTHNVPILMPLTYTPRWASSTPDAPTDVEAGNPPGLSGPPRDLGDWKEFVRTVATRYKGRIHNWEIWNEPNRPQSWTGNVETLVEMTHEAFIILKEIDPTNIVVSPAPTGTGGLKFLDAFLATGGGQYADVIGYHFYVRRDDPPEAVVALIDSVRTILARHGVDTKPLWNTEAGWLGPDMLPPQVGAAYLARAYILNWTSGVTRFYWYAWENHHGTQIELTQQDNASLTPAGKAFAVVETWMMGGVLTGCAIDRNVWTCNLQRSSGSTHILWSPSGDTSVDVPASWHAKEAVFLDETRRNVLDNRVSIGVAPELIQ